MVKPASSFSNVRLAVVSMLSGVMPALPSCAESAMLKQPACAAAINSSGLVPRPFSKRVENEYWAFESTPLSVETVPLPSLSEPFHTAEALRTIEEPPPHGRFYHWRFNSIIRIDSRRSQGLRVFGSTGALLAC